MTTQSEVTEVIGKVCLLAELIRRLGDEANDIWCEDIAGELTPSQHEGMVKLDDWCDQQTQALYDIAFRLRGRA